MSYILAALEKADKERKKKRGLSFENVSEPNAGLAPESGRRSKSAMLLWGSFGLALVLALAWQLSSQKLPDTAVSVTPDMPLNVSPVPAVTPSVADFNTPQTYALPDQLEVEGIVFVQGQPSRSRVFIGGKGYKSGEIYQGNTRVLSISETRITLSNGTNTQSYPIP